jgi:YD repeat-containing protein
VIQAESQVLEESWPVTGTPFNLHYSSKRAPGRAENRSLTIPLSGDDLPASLKGISVTVTTAGQRRRTYFTAEPNLNYEYVWDRRDAYGRPVYGTATAQIKVSYVYDMVYYAASSDFERSFNRFGEASDTNDSSSNLNGGQFRFIARRASQILMLDKIWSVSFPDTTSPTNELGGLSLDIHHKYSTRQATLYRGDGEVFSVDANAKYSNTIVAELVASTDSFGYGIPSAYDLTFAPDGSLYFRTSGRRLHKVSSDGILSTFNLTYVPNCPDGVGDGGPFTEAGFCDVDDLASGSDGSLYLEDNGLRRIDPQGIIDTIATLGWLEGDENICNSSDRIDEGKISSLRLEDPQSLKVDANDNLYFEDCHRVWRLDKTGYLTALTGKYGLIDEISENILASQDNAYRIHAIELTPDGGFYIIDRYRNIVGRVNPQGIISTVAGNESYTNYDRPTEGGLAINEPIGNLRNVIALDNYSFLMLASYYTGDTDNYYIDTIYQIDARGIIRTLVSETSLLYVFQDGRFSPVKLKVIGDSTLSPDKNYLYFSAESPHQVGSRIYRIRLGLPQTPLTDYIVPNQDGTQYYMFDRHGRHLATRSAIDQTLLYQFDYNDAGYLISVTDGDGDVTVIERNSTTGDPTAIVSPDGLRTILTVDEHGYVNSVR